MRRKLLGALLLLTLAGCLDIDYYLSSMTGHLQLISKRQSISELLQQPSTPAELQLKLQQVTEIRDFASQSLMLPDNHSYRSYVQLDRPYVVWNVIATPEFSLRPLQWCFPVVGCVSYRGYFDQQAARDFALQLSKDGYDTIQVGVPAYSTLNWFDDPVLSSFSHWPVTSLAKLIFHELAHQKLYLPDDSAFNESFATTVEQIGIELWLEQRNDPRLDNKHQQQEQRREQFNGLLRSTRAELENLYNQPLSKTEMRDDKAAIFSELRNRYELLKEEWQGFSGYDGWFEQLNNARFASRDTYHRWVPAFKLAYRQENFDLESFYRRCQAIAALPELPRRELLEYLLAEAHSAGEKD